MVLCVVLYTRASWHSQRCGAALTVWPVETFLSGTVPFCLDRERPHILVVFPNTRSRLLQPFAEASFKKRLNSQSACRCNAAKVALRLLTLCLSLDSVERSAPPAPSGWLQAKPPAALIYESVCLQMMNTIFLVGKESEPDCPKKTEAGVKRCCFKTVLGFPVPSEVWL